MFGFTIIYKQKKPFRIDKGINLEFISKSKSVYLFNYQNFKKFSDDKIFSENEHFILGIDGVVLNLKQLKNDYSISDYFNLIVHLWEKSSENFPNLIKGEFSGFIFNKKDETLYVFCNQTASKKVFYRKFSESLIISPSIKYITRYSKSNESSSNLNISAAYELLTFGGMFENQTLINDVFRLQAAEYLKVDAKEISINRYYDFNTIEPVANSKKTIFQELSKSFEEAVKLQYEKDLEYDFGHIATLSGGLDSRLNVMLSNELKYKNDVFCFSQSNYSDAKISKKIAKDLNLPYTFIPLDEGDYLKDISENNEIYNGLIFYLSSAHFNNALKQIDLNAYGLIHTGQIGDGVLGGLISSLKKGNYFSKKISSRLLHKVKRNQRFEDGYRSEEIYQLYNRVFNITHSGSFIAEHHNTYLVSPFMDIPFIETCFSIEPKLRYKQKIYVEWLNHKYPKVAQYTWERIGFKPNKIYKIYLSRYTNKLKKEFYSLIQRGDKLSMNPIDYWFKHNHGVQNFYEKRFNETIHLIEDNVILSNDVKEMYKSGSAVEKSMILTLLDFIETYKLKV